MTHLASETRQLTPPSCAITPQHQPQLVLSHPVTPLTLARGALSEWDVASDAMGSVGESAVTDANTYT